MGRMTKIEIHFLDDDAGAQRIVIMPNIGVDAIFLRGSENQVTFKQNPQPDRTILTQDTLDGLIIEGQVLPRSPNMFSARGPGDVCYLQGGLLKCWKA